MIVAATWEEPEKFLLVHDPGKALNMNVQVRGEKALFATVLPGDGSLALLTTGDGAGMGVESKNVPL